MSKFQKNSEPKLTPYMSPVEFSQLLAAIEAVRPTRLLEWGMGGGTKALLEACGFIERYVAIEHNPVWYEAVVGQLEDSRLEAHLVEADVPRPTGEGPQLRKKNVAWDAEAEQDRSMMASYIDFPSTLGLTFDFVLVDGRARCFCLERGYGLLRPGGVIALHDAQREAYHEAVRALGPARYLTPFDQGQICLVHKP